tara:strand:+ start:1690 stop:1860 length:171 start_codon:yes stop_codon:yes gene_type:complete
MTDNYYKRRFGCTRNQYRRVKNMVRYDPIIDGDEEEYKLRRSKILNTKLHRDDSNV